jgi:glycosidase
MKYNKILFIIVTFLVSNLAFAQATLRVYPSHWWTGMKNNKVQLMVYHPDGVTTSKTAVVSNSPDIRILKYYKPENHKYLFVDIEILSSAKPGIKNISVANLSLKESFRIPYELKARRKGKGTSFAQGINSSDLVYLLMPDRFSNGDPGNDRLPGYQDQTLNRDSMYHRHGGDLQGVINRLDYLQDLGVTSVWMTPVLENDMVNRTEHGYAITDHYQVDRRHGGNEAYHRLSDELHKRGMKLVQDAVYNHVGLHHFFVKDLPMKDWLHNWPSFTQTSYKDQTLMDLYASKKDERITSDGWFVRQMPDLNHHNPYVANFLIQHAIWSVEEFGLDGWRIDTYIYNDLPFMNRCNKALIDEYPKMTMFGETWVHGVLNQAYFTENNLTNIKFKSNLPQVTDFQTNLYGINPALTQNFGWTEGVNRLYQTLANDFVYKNPMNHVIFLDNHDMTRFLTQVGEDVDKLKMGIGWLMTCRGIPQLYYGTEILLKGAANPDGLVRGDFFGGWPEDKQNKFSKEGRTTSEDSVYNWTRTLANFRKKSSAIKTGKMMQFVPEDWVYTYFRYDDRQTVMVVMNTASTEKTIDASRFEERTNGFRSGRIVTGDKTIELTGKWTLPAKTIWVVELIK